jgi:carboxyl-terminal processing protease
MPAVFARLRSSSVLLLGALLGVTGTLTAQHFPTTESDAELIAEAEAGSPRGTKLEREQFHEALDLVLDRHVDQVDTRSVMARGLKHMVVGLDPHSYYLTADERELARKRAKQGADAGLIVALREHEGERLLEVLAVAPGGPAERAKLAAGDRIVAIRGQESEQLLSHAEAEILLAGGEGERIELEVVRGTSASARIEKLELELAKPAMEGLVGVELERVSGHVIGHITIRSFRSGVGEQVKRELDELRRSAGRDGLDGIVLDLRGNPGGSVDEAVVIADLFVAEGVLTRTRGRGGTILREEKATAAGSDTDTPLVVLQDRRSASASELLAVALQDHGRATIVGERSYGKGTVQEQIGIADGSLLSLTIARYFSPNDRAIDGQGVEPDIVLVDTRGDAALETADDQVVRLLAR